MKADSVIVMLGIEVIIYNGFLKLSTATGSFQWLLEAFSGFWKLSVESDPTLGKFFVKSAL